MSSMPTAGGSGPPSMMSFGPYRIEEVLGKGVVGMVFRAVPESGGERVALKVLRAELADDETCRRRFVHEARAAAEVHHTNLLPILDAGEVEGRAYVASPFAGWGSLAASIAERGGLPVQETARIARDLAGALDALHVAGLVHRDIKPSNVVFPLADTCALTDFGLARGPAYTALTRPGWVMGTLDFLAPEVIRGQPADRRSDLYAFGCLVYTCLTGAAPFAERSVVEVARAHLEMEPQLPSVVRLDLPPGLAEAVLSALEKDPARRPPTALAYAETIVRSLGGAVS